LLRSFNSITEIKEASFEDLRKLGLPIKLINEIKEVLK
jgi:excinuclease UvrABC nuclease subunit